MTEKQSLEIKKEIKKKATRGKAITNADKPRETYRASGFTSAGDRITPYEADEDLSEKGNIFE